MNNVQLYASLKNILQGLSDKACFELMARALDAKEFDFVNSFCDPEWKLLGKVEHTNSFMPALLYHMMQDCQCDLETVKFLLKGYSIDPNTPSRSNTCLLEEALCHCDLDVAKYLIKHGADPKRFENIRWYSDVQETLSGERLIRTFELMNKVGLPVEWDALIKPVFKHRDNTAEVIYWLASHGHGHYAGNVPFHAEEYLLRDVVKSIINEEVFPTDVWLAKLNALLRGGFNPNPVVENDEFSRAMRLIDYVAKYAKKGHIPSIKVEQLLRSYND